MSYKNGKNRKFFLDMDGVAFDFGGARDALGMTSQEFKMMPGAYRGLQPYPGVVDNVLKLIDMGWDVWVATKIPDENPLAATEKLFCIHEHMPFLKKSVIITPNKGTLGDEYDFLLDDRPHKAHCNELKGTLLTYGFQNEFQNWTEVMDRMAKHSPYRSTEGHALYEEWLVGDRYVRIFDPRDGSTKYALYADIPEQYHKSLNYWAQVYYGKSFWSGDKVPMGLVNRLLDDHA